MAVTLKALLADKAKFPDGVMVNVGGEEISLGDIRKQDAESHGEITRTLEAREAKAAEKERLQQQATNNLAGVLENVSKATGLSYEQLVSGQIPEHLRSTVKQAVGETRTSEGVKLSEDPLYKPLFDGAIIPLVRDLQTVKKATGDTITAYINDRARLNYLDFHVTAEVPKGYKRRPYDEVLQIAVSKGYKDELGSPDVGRVLREEVSGTQAVADKQAEYERGIAEGKKQAQVEFLGSLGQPTGGTGGIHFENPEPRQAGQPAKVATIKDQLDKAFSDPAIAASMFTGGSSAVQ